MNSSPKTSVHLRLSRSQGLWPFSILALTLLSPAVTFPAMASPDTSNSLSTLGYSYFPAPKLQLFLGESLEASQRDAVQQVAAATESEAASSTPSDPAAAAPAEPTAKPKDYRTGYGYAGLPLLNYDSDDGVGFGVKVARYNYGENQRPYKTQLSLQIFFTSRLSMYHELYYDAPNFRGTPWRIDTYLKLDQVLLNNYYGIGNTADAECPVFTDPSGTDLSDESQGRVCNYYLSFKKLEPKWILNLRRDLDGPFKLFSGLQVKMTNVVPHTAQVIKDITSVDVAGDWSSYLESEKPYGYGGGIVSYVQGGVIADARDQEASPKFGIFSELSARLGSFNAFQATDSAGRFPIYGGLNLTSRHYVQFLPYTVFASRVVADFLVGDVPFFELTSVGGSRDYSAVGGGTSGRGIPSYRYRGKVKLIVSPEIRFTPVEVYAAKTQKINIGLVAFSDLGRVWADYAPDGELLDFHVTVGGGLRVAWNDNFLIRLDYGVAPQEDTTGFYLTFNHAF